AGATIHVDTEHDEAKDLTFELVRAIGAAFPDGPQLGCVVQAYRKDAYADLRALVDWSRTALRTPLQIRLVKGAYWDAETIVARGPPRTRARGRDSGPRGDGPGGAGAVREPTARRAPPPGGTRAPRERHARRAAHVRRAGPDRRPPHPYAGNHRVGRPGPRRD